MSFYKPTSPPLNGRQTKLATSIVAAKHLAAKETAI